MRRYVFAVCASGMTFTAFGQEPPLSAGPTPPPAGFQMPGVSVGQPLLRPVGTQLPKAAPPAGTPVGTPPGASIPPDINANLPGPKIDLSNVVGPLPETNMVLPTEPTLWDKFVAKFGASLGLVQPQPTAPDWTPGLSRRNRERAKERQSWWRRE